MATLFFRVLAHDDKEAGLAQAITDLGEARETEVAHAVDPDSFARERRRSMLTSLKLRDIGPAPRLSVELADRLNIFTGDNGLGKTFILDIAWWALTGDWADLPAWPRPADGESPKRKFQPQIKFHSKRCAACGPCRRAGPARGAGLAAQNFLTGNNLLRSEMSLIVEYQLYRVDRLIY